MLFIAIKYRLLLVVLSVTANLFLSDYDTSTQLLYHPSLEAAVAARNTCWAPHLLASTFDRWDAVHLAGISIDGYVYEHNHAFYPGAYLAHFLFFTLLSPTHNRRVGIPTLSTSLSCAQARNLSVFHPLLHSLRHKHFPSLCLSFSLAFPRSCSCSRCLFLVVSCSFGLSLLYTHTHTHTYAQSHPHT